jgi:hypothetical protein
MLKGEGRFGALGAEQDSTDKTDALHVVHECVRGKAAAHVSFRGRGLASLIIADNFRSAAGATAAPGRREDPQSVIYTFEPGVPLTKE